MPSLEERVAYLEGRFGDHIRDMDDLRTGMTGLRTDMGALRTELRADMGELRTELRSEMGALRTEVRTEMSTLGTELRKEMSGVRDEMTRRFEAVDGRLGALDQKVDRHFTWIVGMQFATLVAIVGALVGAYYK